METNKKNVLMICSWLDHKSKMGCFFIDQALMLSQNFNMTLLHFRPYPINLKSEFKKLFLIEKFIYSDGVTIVYINFPSIPFFKTNFFEKIIEKNAVIKILKFLKNDGIKIDLIHAQSIFNAAFWALLFQKKSRIPYILTEHNQFTLKNVTLKKQKKLDRILNKSRFNIVVSNDLIRQFASNQFFYDFINIGNSVDDKLYNYKNRIVDNSCFQIITIGAYTPVKDQMTLLKSLKILDDLSYIETNFTWIGINSWGGDFETEVEKLVSSFKFKNIKIKVLKLSSKEDIIEALNKSNVFITTSICETFGISVLESLAIGIPVITTQCGGINEMINDTNGIIVPIKDFEAVAKNILKIMTKELTFDNELISKQIIDKFGTNSFTNKMSSIYHEAML